MHATVKTMRMTIRLTVDPEAWATAYGDRPNAADVQAYVASTLSQCAAAQDGAIVSAEVVRR